MLWAVLALSASAFFSALTNKVILCVQTFEMSLVRSGIFIRGYSWGNVLPCVLQVSSLPRSSSPLQRCLWLSLALTYSIPGLGAQLCVAHSNAAAGAAGLQAPSAAWALGSLKDTAAAGHCPSTTSSSWFPATQNGYPPRPLLCHWERAEIPLAEKAEFNNCSAHLTIALFG